MKIIVADDHALFRDGLRHVLGQLGPDTQVIEADSHTGLLACVDHHRDADLVLVDLNMPGSDGIASLQALLAQHPTLLLVVLSASEDVNDIRRVLDTGAMGFIPKRESSNILLSALRLVLEGGIYVPPLMLQAGVAEITRSKQVVRAALTPRQLDVLRELVNGKANKEIGQKLVLSEATVKVHITAIFRVLNVTNRTQAALAAEKLGLLSASS